MLCTAVAHSTQTILLTLQHRHLHVWRHGLEGMDWRKEGAELNADQVVNSKPHRQHSKDKGRVGTSAMSLDHDMRVVTNDNGSEQHSHGADPCGAWRVVVRVRIGSDNRQL